MSLMECMRTKQCSCGKLYKTDCGTLGVNRKRCGICAIADSIEKQEEIVAVVFYIVSKSDIQNNDLKQITRKLLKDKLSNEIIDTGLDNKLLDEIYSVLDSDNSQYMTEVRRDLAKFLKEPDNINDFINTLLIKK